MDLTHTYKKMSMKHHPDKVGGDEVTYNKIHWAYNNLLRHHDHSLNYKKKLYVYKWIMQGLCLELWLLLYTAVVIFHI